MAWIQPHLLQHSCVTRCYRVLGLASRNEYDRGAVHTGGLRAHATQKILTQKILSTPEFGKCFAQVGLGAWCVFKRWVKDRFHASLPRNQLAWLLRARHLIDVSCNLWAALCSRCTKARAPKVEPPNRAARSALSSRRLISTNTNGVGNRCNLTDTTRPVSEHLCAIACRSLWSVSLRFTDNITLSVSRRFSQPPECALPLPESMIQSDQC